MLIITYDEGGGFYDHQHPPATVPPGDSITDPANNHNNFDFTQLGVRVPAIVCSPWIPRNVIDHRTYEHASVPSTTERLWHLPNMTDRDAHAGDFVSLLSLSSPRTDAPTSLPDAAQPEVHCPGDAPSQTARGGQPAARPARATILDPITLAHARQENPGAITSTAAAFLQVAVRRDLLLAPKSERRAIFAQARRFQTIGEVGAYAQQVLIEINRTNATRRAGSRPELARPHQTADPAARRGRSSRSQERDGNHG
jgi:phospholipase C